MAALPPIVSQIGRVRTDAWGADSGCDGEGGVTARGGGVQATVSCGGVTLSFKVKTECISLCMLRSIFTHKTINSKIIV
jgi:hypothetical protein